jgi:hypothetical protein
MPVTTQDVRNAAADLLNDQGRISEALLCAEELEADIGDGCDTTRLSDAIDAIKGGLRRSHKHGTVAQREVLASELLTYCTPVSV